MISIIIQQREDSRAMLPIFPAKAISAEPLLRF
jgi:hypothetical protein